MIKVLPMILFGVFFEPPHLIRGDIPIPNSWEDFFHLTKYPNLVVTNSLLTICVWVAWNSIRMVPQVIGRFQTILDPKSPSPLSPLSPLSLEFYEIMKYHRHHRTQLVLNKKCFLITELVRS